MNRTVYLNVVFILMKRTSTFKQPWWPSGEESRLITERHVDRDPVLPKLLLDNKGSDTRRAKHGAKHGTKHGAKHEAKHETLAYTNAKHRAKRETKHKTNPETFCETLRYNLL